MPNVSYDTLSIKIEADSTQANSSISKLSASLRKLDEASKELDFGKIKEVRGLLQSIAKIDFSNVTNGLQSVVTAFKSLSASAKKSMESVKSSINDNTDLEKITPVIDTSKLEKKIPFAVMVDNKSIDDASKEIKKAGENLAKEVNSIDTDKKVNVGVVIDKEKVHYTKKELKEIGQHILEVSQPIIVDTQAIEQYRKTLKSLSDEFSQIAINGKNAVEVTNEFANLKTPLEEFASTLYEIGINETQMREIFKSMDFETDVFNQDQIDAVYQGLIKLGKSNEEAIEIIGRLKQEVEETANAFSSLGLNASQEAEILRALNYETKSFSAEEIERVREALRGMGYSAEKVEDVISRLSTDFKKLGTGTEKSKNGFQKLMSQFGKIMKYRIIRKIIQEIYKALTEGIKNVVAFDSSTQEAFQKILNSFQYFKNSIGSILAPIIQAIQPVLSFILEAIGDINNGIAEMFASMNGQTQFAKAKKDVEAYNNELKKTQSIGIDELNVIQQNNDGFEMVDVQQSETMQTIGNILAEIKPIIEKVITKAKEFITTALPKIMEILEPVLKIVGNILDLFDVLFTETADGVNSSLYDFLNAVKSILNFVAKIVEALMPVLVPIVRLIGSLLNTINSLLSSIFVIVDAIFEILSPILEALKPIFEIIGMIVEVIGGALGGVLQGIAKAIETIIKVWKAVIDTMVALFSGKTDKIGQIWKELGDNLKKIWAGVGNFFIRVINGLISGFESFLNWFVDKAGVVASWFGVDTSNWGVHFGRIQEISYASGGFPEDGLFFANHNELIGQFDNGKTAVANNEQITQGIYEAVRDAMKESGGQSISIQIDGQELAKLIKKKQDNFGADLFVGGNLAYGK